MTYKKTYNPCDECNYSYSKNNQESGMCKICEFKELVEKSEREQTRWIPVSERLPDNSEHDWVLAQVRDYTGFMCIPRVMEYRATIDDWYDEELGFLKKNHGDSFNVLAWMPLPEPYKAGERE